LNVLEEAEAAASIEKSYLDERSHRQLDRSRQYQDEMDAEELAEQLKQRYASQSHGFRGNVDHVPQNLLMPDVKDPKLWCIRCKVHI